MCNTTSDLSFAEKKTIRKNTISLRNELSKDAVDKKSEIICSKIFELNEFKNADIVLCYSDFNNEVKTDNFIDMALSMGKKVYLPKIDEKYLSMDFYRITNRDELVSGYYGIFEPDCNSDKFIYENDSSTYVFSIIPGVAFDKCLHRIGYGKAFYDRFFYDKQLIYKCALAYDLQVYDIVPSESTDIKMDCIITEKDIIKD